MKKAIALFALLCALSAAAGAQSMHASPFEGRWAWNGQGEVVPEFTVLVFFGNIMLLSEGDLPYYMGLPFIHAGGVIALESPGGFEWQYRFSGNTLHLTNEDGESVSFARAGMQESPLEGLWRVTGGAGYDPHEEQLILFTGDIMAFNEDGRGFMGFGIEFEGMAFRPSLGALEDELHFMPEDLHEEFLASLLMYYNRSGSYLTLSHQGEEIALRRIY